MIPHVFSRYEERAAPEGLRHAVGCSVDGGPCLVHSPARTRPYRCALPVDGRPRPARGVGRAVRPAPYSESPSTGGEKGRTGLSKDPRPRASAAQLFGVWIAAAGLVLATLRAVADWWQLAGR